MRKKFPVIRYKSNLHYVATSIAGSPVFSKSFFGGKLDSKYCAKFNDKAVLGGHLS